MTPRRPHPLLVIAWASLAIASSVGAAQAQDRTAEFYFANSTNASIRVEMLEGAGLDSFEPRIVPPRQGTRISIPPGPHIFDLVAFKAWPPHTHRIGIDAIASERTDPRQSGNMTAYISFRPDQRGIRCPEGYRLHYQGFCINIADELADENAFGVRTVPPTQ